MLLEIDDCEMETGCTLGLPTDKYNKKIYIHNDVIETSRLNYDTRTHSLQPICL